MDDEGLKEVHYFSCCWTTVFFFTPRVADQVQESWVMDGLDQFSKTLGGWKIACTHLHQEHTETVDVHLGCLESRVAGLGGSVHWTAGILGLKLTLEVGGAVVRDLGEPASVGRGLEENVGTAEVPVDDGVWGYVVEIVERTAHVDCNGEDVFQRKTLSWTSVDQSSETIHFTSELTLVKIVH